MTASTFDTLAAADQLRRAGFDEAQSRAIVDIHRTASGALATRADLDALRAELRADLYRALWIQGAGIIAILIALRFLPI